MQGFYKNRQHTARGRRGTRSYKHWFTGSLRSSLSGLCAWARVLSGHRLSHYTKRETDLDTLVSMMYSVVTAWCKLHYLTLLVTAHVSIYAHGWWPHFHSYFFLFFPFYIWLHMMTDLICFQTNSSSGQSFSSCLFYLQVFQICQSRCWHNQTQFIWVYIFLPLICLWLQKLI